VEGFEPGNSHPNDRQEHRHCADNGKDQNEHIADKCLETHTGQEGRPTQADSVRSALLCFISLSLSMAVHPV
jgi:hypothetical protein